jgi:hypothetical protein
LPAFLRQASDKRKENMALIFRRLAMENADEQGGIEPNSMSEDFMTYCLVKLKVEFYGSAISRELFDPRIMGEHRDAFAWCSQTLETAIVHFQKHISNPFLCPECGVYGDRRFVALSRNGTSFCLGCPGHESLMLNRFIASEPPSERHFI